MTKIHPTAIVSEKAVIGSDVKVGPYAVIEDDVEIGNECSIGPHACIYNGARIGNNVKIFQSASVSNVCQDLKYAGEEAYFYIGDNTTIREFVTLHKGTAETGMSRVGSNCLIMAYAHVAHDCEVGDNCILANAVQMAGHVEIEDNVIIGGLSAIHQFCKIGKHTMIGGGSKVRYDVPPFIMTSGEPMKYTGLNLVGLRRRGFSNDDLKILKDAYAVLFSNDLNFTQAKEKLASEFENERLVKEILEFLNKCNRTLIKR
jgi:UDP-N-acetylglucosamine acyltransferase